MGLRSHIGIDLGTHRTRLLLLGKGVVIDEPTAVAFSEDSEEIIAYGEQAHAMRGKTPEHIKVRDPIRRGVVWDDDLAAALLRYFIGKVLGRWQLFKPDVVLSVPAEVTQAQRYALIEAALNAGARNAYVIKKPVLAGIGAGTAIHEPGGHMIVDIGAGTTDVAVISLGGIVSSASIHTAGDIFTTTVSTYLKNHEQLVVGEQTAEYIKHSLKDVGKNTNGTLEVAGTHLLSGGPSTVLVSLDEVATALRRDIDTIVNTIKDVLHQTPPEIMNDVLDKGLVLTGGSTKLGGLRDYLSRETTLPVRVAPEAELCVIRGIAGALKHLDSYKKSIMNK